MNPAEPENPSSKPQSTAEDERNEKRSALLQIARYSQIAFALPAATVLGWLLGLLLDRWLHTTWIYIAGLILGIIVGFVELIRMVMADSK
ncbi:MAG TPA: AtpZ/AtpI family protein [Terriglobales bacterium]|jgi:F0F1-type ATP synthase assembly protein I|nr:AtpZ/AtpI family protein [Terriglobales bacterium]